MVITYNNKTETILDKNDLFNLIKSNEPEMAKALEDINIDRYSDLKERYENLDDEFRSYESSNESLIFCLNEVQDVARELKRKVKDAKRLDRAEIIDYLESIIDTINNEI